MEQLTNNVVDAFKDVVANVTPIIQNIVAALPTATGALSKPWRNFSPLHFRW